MKKNEIVIREEETVHDVINIDIPQENIDRIVALADENAMWVKITDGGFMVNDKVIPEIKGIILGVNPYYVMWLDKKPTKIPFKGQAQPEGYELRCDVRIDVSGTIIGLSLPKTSTKTHLAQYLKFLKQSGLKPNAVITRARVKAISSPHGKFNVVIFDTIGAVNDPQVASATAASDIVDISVRDNATPQPAQSSNNPWA